MIKITDKKVTHTLKPDELGKAIALLAYGYATIFKDLPLLRQPTEKEIANNIYVIDNNELYKYRKQVYEASTKAFNDAITLCFPDIVKIDELNNIRQETMFNMSEEDAKNYAEKLEKIVTEVKEELRNETK